jgi:hypothetical protein
VQNEWADVIERVAADLRRASSEEGVRVNLRK